MSKLSSELDSAIRAASKNRCGYCLLPQILASYKLEIEHILPRSKGGKSNIENLCLACRNCNLVKAAKVFGLDIVLGMKVRLFHLNLQNWSENFEWDTGKI